jgi:hypothetical protein
MILHSSCELNKHIKYRQGHIRLDIEVLIYNNVFGRQIAMNEYARSVIEAWYKVLSN